MAELVLTIDLGNGDYATESFVRDHHGNVIAEREGQSGGEEGRYWLHPATMDQFRACQWALELVKQGFEAVNSSLEEFFGWQTISLASRDGVVPGERKLPFSILPGEEGYGCTRSRSGRGR